MKVIVGLGNPGDSYALNRHNVGFRAIDVIADWYRFPEFREKHQGLISQGVIDGEKTILVKPQTYMNLSGRCVRSVCDFFKVDVTDVIAVYDDIDLQPGQLKARYDGGHGGHNGLRDLSAQMGPAYGRVRIGVGHPGHKDQVSGFVLGNFTKTEWEKIEPILDMVAQHLPCMLKKNPSQFSNEIALNRR